jgi:hypothetical protein
VNWSNGHVAVERLDDRIAVRPRRHAERVGAVARRSRRSARCRARRAPSARRSAGWPADGRRARRTRRPTCRRGTARPPAASAAARQVEGRAADRARTCPPPATDAGPASPAPRG